MASPHWIDWPKKIEKYGLCPDGYATAHIGMVPVFRIPFPQGYENAHLVNCSFIEGQDELQKFPLAWIFRVGRQYVIMTNVSYDADYDFFVGYHQKTNEKVYQKRKRQDSVQYGPFKSLHTAVKELRALQATKETA